MPRDADSVELVTAIIKIDEQWFIAHRGKIDWTPYANRADAIRAIARLDEASEAELRG